MASQKNPVRKVFDGVERKIGGPLEEAINTPSGGNALLTIAKLSRFGLRQVRAIRTQIVHLAALPTNRDVDVLSARIGRLQETVEELTQQIEESRSESGPLSRPKSPKPRPRRTPPG